MVPSSSSSSETTELEGLTDTEAAARLTRDGRNVLPEPPVPGVPRRVLRSLRDPLVLVLLTALALTMATGDWSDAAVIALVILVNSTIGVRQEVQADRAVRALSAMVATRAWVVRSGRPARVPVDEVVSGDLLRLRQGDLVPADAVLVEGVGLQVDESTLTGESFPVDKEPGADPGTDPLTDQGAVALTGPGGEDRGLTGDGDGAGAGRSARLLSGSVVVHGRGLARVTTTGSGSSIGRLAALMQGPAPATPLQLRMARLSAQLAVVAVALSCLVLGLGLLRGEGLEAMVLTTIALVVAAVPESLPLVVTVGLALAARRMANRHAVVRNLAAVETLGSVTVLATDKTGTLTRGSMTVRDTWCPPGVESELLWRGLTLCSDAALDDDAENAHADPTEEALLRAAATSGVDAGIVRSAFPRIGETPFDSVRKRMSTTHTTPDGGVVTWHKGAPDAMLTPEWLGADDGLDVARAQADAWARHGRRVIAVVAEGPSPAGCAVPRRLVGLVALEDPVRSTSRATVGACRAAGMRVILVTGDHPATAEAIAAQVGIGDGSAAVNLAGRAAVPFGPPDTGAGVVARATPADKHALITALQAAGHVVAMTGDGVNDAPALRQADIGVAMGIRGTEVARQAADLVLTDDELGTVVAAVEEGRRVYANIRRFLTYGLSGGASEVFLMLAGPVAGTPLPLTPAQILWLNLLTHTFAGAGLAAQPADTTAMSRGPRSPEEGPLAGGLGWRTALLAVLLTALGLVAIALAPSGSTQTSALMALGAGQLGVAWGLRTPRRRRTHDLRDPLLPLLLLAGAMLVAVTLLPPVRQLLGTVAIGPQTWLVIGCCALAGYAGTRLLRARAV